MRNTKLSKIKGKNFLCPEMSCRGLVSSLLAVEWSQGFTFKICHSCLLPLWRSKLAFSLIFISADLITCAPASYSLREGDITVFLKHVFLCGPKEHLSDCTFCFLADDFRSRNLLQRSAAANYISCRIQPEEGKWTLIIFLSHHRLENVTSSAEKTVILWVYLFGKNVTVLDYVMQIELWCACSSSKPALASTLAISHV